MLNDVTFGQYYPAESFVHKMDSRAKILLTIAYITCIFLIKNFYGFIACGGFLFAVVFISKVPLSSVIKSIKGILFLIIFTAVINLFFYSSGGKVLVHFWIINIYESAVIFTVFMAVRLFLLVMGTSVLTLTTTPVALTDGIESLLKPLNYVRFPVHELALIMSIALRFIPTLMDETDRIIRAQKARGADFESGGLIKRAKALIPILIPLLVSAFRRAEELGDAMDARCYSGAKGRTKYKKLKYGLRDLFGFVFLALLIAAIIYMNIKLGKII